MKSRHILRNIPAASSAMIVIAALALSSCADSGDDEDAAARTQEQTSIEDVKRESGELAETVAEYGADQRDEAMRKFKSAMADVDQRLQHFEQQVEENWDDLSEEARGEAQQNLAMLKTRRAELADAYDELKSDSGAAWEEIKHGFTEAYAEISTAIDEAEDEFGNG